MRANRITKNDYLDRDLSDLDHVCWADLAPAAAVLRPTGDLAHDVGSLLANRAPVTQEKLRLREGEVMAAQFVLTAPKPFSVLELLGVEPRFAGVAVAAARECLRLVTLLATPAGRLPDGVTPSSVAALVAMQRLTKADMPHRHVHLGFFSLGYHPEKRRVTGLDLGLVLHHGKLFQTLFQHVLAWEAAQLGYRVVAEGDAFTFADFPRELTERFASGPRSKKSTAKAVRSAESFSLIHRGWRAQLTATEEADLASLPRSVREEYPYTFATAFAASLQRQLGLDCYLPAGELAVRALQDTYGQVRPELSLLVRCVAGGLAGESPNLRAFNLGRQLCYGTPEGLAEDKAFCGFLTQLKPAHRGWFAGPAPAAWWAPPLREDTHRLLVLRGNFATEAVRELQAALPGVKVVADVETSAVRRMLPELQATLQRGGRVLLLGQAEPDKACPWLEQLRRFGVPVVGQTKSGAVRLSTPAGAPSVKPWFCPGPALHVYAKMFAHRRGALLLCNRDEVDELNLAVRALRRGLARCGAPPTSALALVPSTAAVAPGNYVQFRKNTAGVLASEALEVKAVTPEGLQVRRPDKLGMLSLRIPAARVGDLDVFVPVRRELAAGDRIRLLRNAPAAAKSGLRTGRRYQVTKVKRDGTVLLDCGLELPPGFGHWAYDYCADLQGPVRRGQLVVCSAEQLPLAVQRRWVADGAKSVYVCAPSLAQASDAVRVAFPEASNLLCPAELSELEELEADALALALLQEPAAGREEPAAELNPPESSGLQKAFCGPNLPQTSLEIE